MDDLNDDEITEQIEQIREPWRHATMHTGNVDEHDDLWRECEALQTEIDALYAIVLQLAGAFNAALPMPIALDE